MAADSKSVDYFLSLAVKDLLAQILMWNTATWQQSESNNYFSLELDTLMCIVFNNLVLTAAAKLTQEKDMWILERFRSRMTVSDFKARREAHCLMLSLVQSLTGEEKTAVVMRLDLIGGLI